MTSRSVLIVIGLIFLGILGFDAYLYLDHMPGNSITQTVIAIAEKSMLVPFFVGFLMGFLAAHFFDNYKEPRE